MNQPTTKQPQQAKVLTAAEIEVAKKKQELLLVPLKRIDQLRDNLDLILPERLMEILETFFEDVDNPEPVIRALGDEAFDRLQMVIIETFESGQSFYDVAEKKNLCIRDEIVKFLLFVHVSLLSFFTNSTLVGYIIQSMLLEHQILYLGVFFDKIVWKIMKIHCDLKELVIPKEGEPPRTLPIHLKTDKFKTILPRFPKTICKQGCQFVMGKTQGSKNGRATSFSTHLQLCSIVGIHAIVAFIRDVWFDEFYEKDTTKGPLIPFVYANRPAFWSDRTRNMWTDEDEVRYYAYHTNYYEPGTMNPRLIFVGRPTSGKKYYPGADMPVEPNTRKAYEAVFWNTFGWPYEMPNQKKEKGKNGEPDRVLGHPIEYLNKSIPKMPDNNKPPRLAGESADEYLARLDVFEAERLRVLDSNEWWHQMETFDLSRYVNSAARTFVSEIDLINNYYWPITNFSEISVGVPSKEVAEAAAKQAAEDKKAKGAAGGNKRDDGLVLPLNTRQETKGVRIAFASPAIKNAFFKKFNVREFERWDEKTKRNVKIYSFDPPVKGTNTEMYFGMFSGFIVSVDANLVIFNNGPTSVDATTTTPKLINIQQFSLKFYPTTIYVQDFAPENNDMEVKTKRVDMFEDRMNRMAAKKAKLNDESAVVTSTVGEGGDVGNTGDAGNTGDISFAAGSANNSVLQPPPAAAPETAATTAAAVDQYAAQFFGDNQLGS